MNRRTEKKEYMKILNEIDTILFGTPIKRSCSKIEFQDIVMGFISCTGVVAIISGYFDEEHINEFGMMATGIASGIVGTIFSYKYNERYRDYFRTYEQRYLRLSRNEQIEVLELAKKLSLAIKEEITFKQNKEYFEKWIGQKDNLNMFDCFEMNHPHFEILSQERVDEIHDNGKLTPIEIFNEWMSSGTCIPCDKRRCKEFGNCRDCLVDYANQQEEWKPLTFEPIDFFESITNEDEKSRTLKK